MVARLGAGLEGDRRLHARVARGRDERGRAAVGVPDHAETSHVELAEDGARGVAVRARELVDRGDRLVRPDLGVELVGALVVVDRDREAAGGEMIREPGVVDPLGAPAVDEEERGTREGRPRGEEHVEVDPRAVRVREGEGRRHDQVTPVGRGIRGRGAGLEA